MDDCGKWIHSCEYSELHESLRYDAKRGLVRSGKHRRINENFSIIAKEPIDVFHGTDVCNGMKGEMCDPQEVKLFGD